MNKPGGVLGIATVDYGMYACITAKCGSCFGAHYLEYTVLLQGGTKPFDYPKYVWSPSGGWWCNPRHWRRNTFYAFVIGGALSGVVWYISAQLEVRISFFEKLDVVVFYLECIHNIGFLALIFWPWGTVVLYSCKIKHQLAGY